jgi:hypothetical protein
MAVRTDINDEMVIEEGKIYCLKFIVDSRSRRVMKAKYKKVKAADIDLVYDYDEVCVITDSESTLCGLPALGGKSYIAENEMYKMIDGIEVGTFGATTPVYKMFGSNPDKLRHAWNSWLAERAETIEAMTFPIFEALDN